MDGKATEAALTAVSAFLTIRRRFVHLVSGATSRTKIIDAEDPGTLAALLARPGNLLEGQLVGRSLQPGDVRHTPCRIFAAESFAGRPGGRAQIIQLGRRHAGEPHGV